MKKIIMLAGEPSGDLHGSNLASELKKLSPEIEILGTGGENMKNAGVKVLFDLKDLAVIGLIDVIKKYFHFKKIQKTLLNVTLRPKAEGSKVDLIILIDYPDFNLRFAKLAHRFGIPIIYYISPQVWAWRKGRIKLIKKYVKKIFVIFKFEEEIYKKAGIPVEFVGHPLLDIVKPQTGQPANQWVPPAGGSGEQVIALLPGSRKRLIKTLLPIMLESAKIIHKKFPKIKFLISKIPSVDKKIYEDVLAKHVIASSANGGAKQSLFTIIEGNPYDIIKTSELVLTVSGTSTLETAILGKPMVIIYKLPLLEYMLARPLLRLKNIGLVNIVAGEEIVPECIQFKARPELIAENVFEILTNKQKYGDIKNKLAAVKNSLYPSGAAKKAAASTLQELD